VNNLIKELNVLSNEKKLLTEILNAEKKSSNKSSNNTAREKEVSFEDVDNSKKAYDEIQNFLKTNIQGFFHNLSRLKSLQNLDLSNNKIHFFDIDPYQIQNNNGYNNLTKLNLSNNNINEDLGIILIINLPKLKEILIDGNPLLKKRKTNELFQSESFKNINVLDQPPQIKRNILFNHSKNLKDINFNYPRLKPLKIKYSSTDKLVRKKAKEKQSPKITKTIESTTTEQDKVNNTILQGSIIDDKSSLFLTSNIPINSSSNNRISKNSICLNDNESNNIKVDNNYKEFLRIANFCFKGEKPCDSSLPIQQAYSRLRLLINNSVSIDNNENINDKKHYLQETIINEIRNCKYIPSIDNLKSEFKFLNKLHSLGSNHNNSSKNLTNCTNNSIQKKNY